MWLILRNRGGYTYDSTLPTAFSDAQGLALVLGALVAAVALATVRWAVALALAFGVLVVVLGLAHPCGVFADYFSAPKACSVSSSASALGLYLPAAALACLIARVFAVRVSLQAATAAKLLGAAGVVVLGSLWLPWYGAQESHSFYWDAGWSVFQGFDIYLAVLGAIAVIFALASLRARAPRPGQLAQAVALLALAGAGLTFYRLFTPADAPSSGYVPGAGAYVALAALVAVACCAMASRRES